MLLSTSNPDDVMHVLLAALSVILLVIAINAFRVRPTSRYFLLTLAFVFLCLDQTITLIQEIYFGGLLIAIPFLELHLVHFLELLMLVSFVAALVAPRNDPKT
jgi:hypothetical protein